MLLLIVFGYKELLESSSIVPSGSTSGKTEYVDRFFGGVCCNIGR